MLKIGVGEAKSDDERGDRSTGREATSQKIDGSSPRAEKLIQV